MTPLSGLEAPAWQASRGSAARQLSSARCRPSYVRCPRCWVIAGAAAAPLLLRARCSCRFGRVCKTLVPLQCLGGPISPVGMILVSGVAKISQAKAARRPEFGGLTAENQSSPPNPLQAVCSRAERFAPRPSPRYRVRDRFRTCRISINAFRRRSARRRTCGKGRTAMARREGRPRPSGLKVSEVRLDSRASLRLPTPSPRRM